MYGSYWRYTLCPKRDDDSVLSALDLSAASGSSALYTFSAKEPMRVVRFGFAVTTACAAAMSTAAKYGIALATTRGGSLTQKMTVTVPITATAGMVYYADNGAFDVDVGQQVAITKVRASLPASADGKGNPFFQAYKRAEVDGNMSYMSRVTS